MDIMGPRLVFLLYKEAMGQPAREWLEEEDTDDYDAEDLMAIVGDNSTISKCHPQSGTESDQCETNGDYLPCTVDPGDVTDFEGSDDDRASREEEGKGQAHYYAMDHENAGVFLLFAFGHHFLGTRGGCK